MAILLAKSRLRQTFEFGHLVAQKRRFVRTPDLHARFEAACNILGLDSTARGARREVSHSHSLLVPRRTRGRMRLKRLQRMEQQQHHPRYHALVSVVCWQSPVCVREV